jgi:hypothetical protein
MTRNLKVLGLALVASLALSAMVASAASGSAALFTSSVGATETAKIHGEQVGTDTFTVNGIPLTCATAPVTGEAKTTGSSSTYVEVTPVYGTCHAIVPFIGTRTATVTMNSCRYTFNATKNTNSSSTGPTPNVATPFSADLHITCANAGDGIEVHVYNTANASDAGSTVFCTYKIDPQTVLNQIQLTNEAPAGGVTDILAHVHANVSTTFISGSGGFTCGSGTITSVYKGTDTLTATNAAGASVNSSVS